MTCAVSAAVRDGAEAVVCASTGNTAASAAAYAARAGLSGAVIVPEGKIATGKLAQALMHGARVIAAARQLRRGARARARARRAAPDRARELGQPVPAGGPEDRGVRDRRRRSASSTRCASRSATPATSPPTGRASRRRASRRACSASRPRAPRRSCTASAVEQPETVASAIRIGNPARWEEAMDAIVGSRGAIRRGQRRPRSSTPTACSPRARASSASRPRPPAVAGLLAHGAEGAERVVCVLTGHGLKDPQTALGQAGAVVPCEPDIAAVERAVLRLMQRRRLVRVPASSANLGPGLRRARRRARSCTSRSRSRRPGASRSHTDLDDRPRPAQPVRARLRARCTRPTTSRSRSAPTSRCRGGLGSSAAAIVAGALAADHMFELDADLLAARHRARGPSRQRRGGAATAASSCAPTAAAARFDPPAGLEACSSSRTRAVRTAEARAALPAEVPMADAVFNVAHASLLVLGLARGDLDLIARGLQDRLHQPRRAPPLPAARWRWPSARASSGALGATISGAGPTVLFWCHFERRAASRRR